MQVAMILTYNNNLAYPQLAGVGLLEKIVQSTEDDWQMSNACLVLTVSHWCHTDFTLISL